MQRFNDIWERAWRYYNIDVPEGENDAKMREIKFLSDEPTTLRTVDEDYDEYEDEDEDDEDEDDEPTARSRRASHCSLRRSSSALRCASPGSACPRVPRAPSSSSP